MRRAALLGVLLSLLASAPAAALPSDGEFGVKVNGPAVAHGLAVAAAFWGRTPPGCPRGVRVLGYTLPDGIGGYGGGLGEDGCEIWIQKRHWPRWGATQKCLILVHEYGHVLGLGHVEDPRSVMYSGTLNPRSVPACVRRKRLTR